MKVVVAEDEFLVADMLAVTLEDAGYDVRSASHGAAALKLIEEDHPDLVITDFMMPLMTGLELAEAIKASESLKHIPIVLVSGAQGGIARSRAELFEAILDKPYSLSDILRIAEELTTSRTSD